jgi:hypothetical protein
VVDHHHLTRAAGDRELDVVQLQLAVTIVEPGGARTEFRYGSSVLAEKLDAYAVSPAGAIRRVLEERTALAIGDPAKMAAIIIGSADQEPAPRRIALGSDAYTAIAGALTDRLALLEGQRDLALSTDYPAADS